MLLILGWWGPGLARSALPPGDARGYDLLTLFARAREAVRAADAATGPPSVEHWLAANALAWGFVSRVSGAALAVILAWLGVLVGDWSGRARSAELRRLQQWTIGLCLIVSSYLAAENSWELVVIHAAGPAYFLAWLRIVPAAALLCGLAWVSLVQRWPPLGGEA
jgi:hypothetical protein